MNFENIVELIPEYLYKDKIVLNQQTRLEEDLGYYGEDAELLILDFSKKFNVDISKFNFPLYFSSERNIESIIRSTLNKNSIKKTKSLTLGDLLDAAQSGTLK